MDFGDKEIQGVITGAVGGLSAGFIHALIAGLIIAPLMTGHVFYSYGFDVLGAMVGELIKDVVIGAIMGALGAFIAMVLIQQSKQ